MYQLYHRYAANSPWEFAFTYETLEEALHLIVVASWTPICFHARQWGVFLSDGTEDIHLVREGEPHLQINSLPQWVHDKTFVRLDKVYEANTVFGDKLF